MADTTEERKVKIVLDAQQPNASIKEMAAGAAVLNSQLSKMAADDPGRAKLQDDFARLTARISETRAELRTIIQTEEELAAEQAKLAEQTQALAAAQEQTVRSGQQATASMREMKDAAAILSQQLENTRTDDPGRAALLRDYQVLQQRISAAGEQMRTYQKTAEELAEQQRQLAAETERLNQENREVILNGQKVNASFKEMKDSAALLERQLHELSADDPGRAAMLRDYQQLQKRIHDVQQEMGDTAEKGFTMKDALLLGGVEVGLEAAVDVVKELGAEIAQTVKEFEDLRGKVNTLTNATGAELDQLTSGVAGLAKTFNKEYDEILVASNSLAKQMGISQQEALRLIEQGFIAGADVNGEFLDQLKEYPAQFKAAGVSADEFVGIISQSQTSGVFSDKGVDVVKEFGLRIREQTSATKDALYAAFGPEFTKEILDGVNNGSISSVQALERVSQKMNDTQIPAAQLQTVIADVFGGPGEDAGLDYLKSLKNVGTGIDALVDKNNVYVQRQQELLASNKQLAATQNELAKEFEGTGNSLQVLGNEGMVFIYTLLTSLIVTFKELTAPLREIWDELGRLAESFGLVAKEGSLAKDIANGIGAVLRFLLTPTRLVYEGFGMLARALIEWVKQSEPAKAALLVMIAPLRLLFDLLRDSPAFFEGFVAAGSSAFTRVGRAWKAALRGDFSGAMQEFADLGAGAAREYLRAFNAARALRPEAQASETSSNGGEDPAGKPSGGGDGTTEKDRAKAAADAAKKEREERKKTDQQHLADLKQWVAEEGALLLQRNVLKEQLGARELDDAALRRELERQKLFEAATAKVDKLTGLEADYTEQVKAIVVERDLQLRELVDKHKAEEEERRLKALDEKLALNEADAEVALAELELKLANGVLNEQAYQDAVYAVKQAAHARELALLQEQGGKESAEYKKANAQFLQEQAAHVAKRKGLDEGLVKFQQGLAAVRKLIGSEELGALAEVFGKKSVLYKAFVVAQKALALTEIGLNLSVEMANNAKAAAQNPLNGPTAGAAGATQLFVTNGLSLLRAGLASAKVVGFREGGPTSASAGKGLLDLNQLRVSPGGELLDQDGFAVAGLVHKNEYVIPEWMRADPKVMQVEQWLEQKRQRGGGSYREGGPTTEGDSPVPVGAGLAGESSEVTALLRTLVEGQRRQDERIDTWARELTVVQQMYELDQAYDTYKKVNQQNGVTT
ncbi:phage tail tape measure protein [Hymenobacter canadensis]|uniref:Phage tail tape measure protein domain-containing protein n=1 Tax=Hymenobacter canadensis TaxID=2999067 RepID=A0ABY7LU27_9BACT|nr:phage tail tape measure protein [Hymenobacter canadensis]WBA42991.1 hypothetical protein O3303_05355 [Hymenobacter canadensis]